MSEHVEAGRGEEGEERRTPKKSVSRLRTLSERESRGEHRVWRLVLTGGPCGGKTTAQVSKSLHFVNIYALRRPFKFL